MLLLLIRDNERVIVLKEEKPENRKYNANVNELFYKQWRTSVYVHPY